MITSKKAKTLQTEAQLIMKVRCGLMTVAAATAQLGVSCKTYYISGSSAVCPRCSVIVKSVI